MLTGQDTNSLSKDWDVNVLVDRMKAETEITAAFVKESGAFAANQAKAVDNARKELETTTDPQRRQELQTFIEKNSIWDTGGIGRLASKGDMRVSASNVVATGDLTLASREGDIRVESGRDSGRHHEYQRTTHSGLSSSGCMAVSVGSERTTTNDTTTRTLAHASTLGSLGKVTIDASGGSYTQVGSDVLAQDIAVVEARESTNREQTFEYKKSGFTLGMSTPLMRLRCIFISVSASLIL